MKLIRIVGFGVICVVTAAAVAAGASASSATLDDMTLRESDLPAGFDQLFSHRLPRAEAIEIQARSRVGTAAAGSASSRAHKESTAPS